MGLGNVKQVRVMSLDTSRASILGKTGGVGTVPVLASLLHIPQRTEHSLPGSHRFAMFPGCSDGDDSTAVSNAAWAHREFPQDVWCCCSLVKVQFRGISSIGGE